MTVRAESGLQKWKKMKTYQVIKIYFAEEKGFDLLKSKKANLRNKQVWGKEGHFLDSLLSLY